MYAMMEAKSKIIKIYKGATINKNPRRPKYGSSAFEAIASKIIKMDAAMLARAKTKGSNSFFLPAKYASWAE